MTELLKVVTFIWLFYLNPFKVYFFVIIPKKYKEINLMTILNKKIIQGHPVCLTDLGTVVNHTYIC